MNSSQNDTENMNTRIVPVILSGGQGSRLWPLSRKSQPKQFIPFLDDQSLFEQTIIRTHNADIFTSPVIICAQNHRFLVQRILDKHDITDALIICEPVGRNTAPAFLAAVETAITEDKATNDSVFAMLPADHYIANTKQFQHDLSSAIPLAQNGKIVTFGIKPTKAHTGYGYIQKGKPLDSNGFEVSSFQEKPSPQHAQHFVQSGDYYWNAGMFMFQGKTIRDEMTAYAPQILSVVQKSVEDKTPDLGAFLLNKDSFETAQDISFDYAVMEKTTKASVYPVDFDWRDLGAWDALWELSEQDRDAHDNAIHGDVIALDCVNSYLHSEGDSQVLCAYGLKDIIAVAMPDAILVIPREQSQHVKTLMAELKAQKRNEVNEGRKTYRPWGSYEVLEDSPGYKVKRISVIPGQRLSLQKHQHRNEHWVVVTGTARVTRNDEVFDLKANESAYISCGDVHRLENATDAPLEMIEVQTGDYLGEDDIIRLEDDYNRNATENNFKNTEEERKATA